jgi:hypothetical protein
VSAQQKSLVIEIDLHHLALVHPAPLRLGLLFHFLLIYFFNKQT